MHAWSQMFNEFLTSAQAAEFLTAKSNTEPYTDVDYFAHVDGKPRADGVRSFLAARRLEVPEGTPDDPPEACTIHGLGRRKDDAFKIVLERDGVQAYPGSVALIEALHDQRIRMAVVSSSRNAPHVLAAAGLGHHFEFVMHGGVAEERGLPGKPAPDTFWAAADELGVDHARAVVLEDAISGVRAGAAGGFGLVIGVNRGAGADALINSGADLVVDDLEELL